MREMEIGVRVDYESGLSFFGIEEANDLIRQGGRIIRVEPGGAIMRKLGEDAENVRLTLSGFSIKLHLDSPHTK